MKRLIIAIALMGAAFTAQADGCLGWSKVAEHFMILRQGGMPMAEMIAMVEHDSVNEYGLSMALILVESVYQLPRRHSYDARMDTVDAFRDGFYLACYKGNM